MFEITRFQDPTVRRMLSKLQNREKAALTKDELQEVMDRAPRSLGTYSQPGGWVGQPGGDPECLGQEGDPRGRARAQSCLWRRRESEAGGAPAKPPLPAGGASARVGPWAWACPG